ncbi:hypothetical protein GCM10023149_21340 [Mucilaginibacter gynuensis]|uniref:DUF922 domain-containing protein n=1 Tax=Mucilaginibacter gynuensis TaxID=1302236 RepID=A0ABP8GC18_9SPHI
MKFIYLILFFIYSTTASAQLLKWSKDTLLTWNDFKVFVDTGKFEAISYLSMTYEYRYSVIDGVYKAKFKISHTFDPSKSTTIVSKQTSYLLKHEQTHFDIAEYFARQLRFELESYTYTKNIKDEIIKIYKRVDGEREKMQNLYDSQSKNGRDVNLKKKWEDFVANLLIKNYPLDELLRPGMVPNG